MSDPEQQPGAVRIEPVSVPRGYFITLPADEGGAPGLFDEALQALLASWPVVVSCALSFAALALGAASFVQPFYRSETVLAQPADSRSSSALTSLFGDISLPGIAGLARGLGGEQVEALAILKSRAFTVAFIQEQGLLPVLFADQWDAERAAWRTDEPDEVPTLEDAWQMFDEHVRTITQDNATALVTLSIEWSDRKEAARWANKLVHRVNERLRQRAIEEAQKSIDYLNHELEKTSIVELRQSIYRLIEDQLSKVVVANTQDEYAFRQIDPAAVADEDRFVWPNRLLMTAVGLAAGIFVGLIYAFLRQSRRAPRGAHVRRALER